MPEEVEIPLAGVIRALRRELEEAVTEGEDAAVRFALGEIELELQVAVSSKGGGDAGIKFWVVSLGGRAERGSERTQTLRLKLTPVSGAGGTALTALIVGSEESERPD